MEALLTPGALASAMLWGRAEERDTAQPLRQQAEIALVRAARRGDRNAFARLVDLHKHTVYGVAARMIGSADASDISQDAFLKAFQRLASFDTTKELRPWLIAIVHHCCVDELRRRRRQTLFPTALDQPEHAPLPPPEDAIETRQQTALVVEALNRLPDNQREALLLFHQDQLSYREIGAVLGVPIGTVMTWIHRARRALRVDLEASK